jgi:hypothetical protein
MRKTKEQAQEINTSTGTDSAAVYMEVRGNGGIANYSGSYTSIFLTANAKRKTSVLIPTLSGTDIKEWEIRQLDRYKLKPGHDDADLRSRPGCSRGC